MAADIPTKQIFGTQVTIFDSATDIAAGNFSAGMTIFDNTADAAVPYATHAVVTALFPDWAAAPVQGTTVELWGVLQDTDGTSDDTDPPSGTSSVGARPFGAFPIGPADPGPQRRSITISLEGVKKVQFYAKNGTAQNMNNDGGTNFLVKIQPFSYGVYA